MENKSQNKNSKFSQKFNRANSWYNRDWELQVIEGKKRFVYTGIYFDLEPKDLKLRMRVIVAVSSVILIGVYLLLAFSKTQGALIDYVEYPCLFGFLPLIYFCMGSFWYVYTGEKMTFRRYYASEKRLKAASWIGLVCTAIMTVGDMVFIIIHFSEIQFSSEFFFLIGAVICVGQYVIILRAIHRNPIKPLEEVN